MKKILAIVAVLAMVFALAVPAFAAETDPSILKKFQIVIESSSEKPSDADIGSGNKLLGVYDAKLVRVEDNKEATAEEVAAYIAANGGSIDINFSKYVSQTPVKVLHKIGGSWKSESFSGTLVTGVTSLSPFAFIVKADSQGGGGAPGGKTSPQTGYNTALWAIAAAAMVVCAGYCFVSARKKAAE